MRRLCLGFGCWYPYYVPFVRAALETVGRGPECQTDLEQWDATFGARRDDSRVTSVSTEQNRTESESSESETESESSESESESESEEEEEEDSIFANMKDAMRCLLKAVCTKS